MRLPGRTPREQGYRMPAEWAEHEATWLSWPKNPLTFPEEILANVEAIYCELIFALSEGEGVRVLVEDEKMSGRVAGLLEDSGASMRNVELLEIKSADVWIRDYGPTFLVGRNGAGRAAVKWRFNAWGEKYDDLMYDDKTGEDVVARSGGRVFRPGIVLEGGSIDVNGEGTVLTTEQCLLNKNRNPLLSREQIEGYLRDYVDAPNVIWLTSGIEGDDTDGHVDDFARFVSPNRVVCAHSTSKLTENRAVLDVNLKLLSKATDQDGRALQISKLPMPRPLWLEEEQRWLPASYANFYIGNRAVLLPVFRDRNDKKAIEIISEALPERRIVPVYAADLVYGYGGIHCITQQEPKCQS